MPTPIRRLGRSLVRRLPRAARRRLKTTRLGRVVVRRYGSPLLSVIVPVYNVQDYLAECLDSLLAQTLQRMEIILVDDGSTDTSPNIIADYARRDRRIKIVTQPNSGLGAARNSGIAAATAPYITFLDSDDTIPAAAYARMVQTLKRTRSDFAVGAVRRVTHGKISRPPWVQNVHRSERLRITIDEFPDAMQDVIACNRMFRRDFWNERIGPFPVGVAYEDHAPMVAAYVRASAFDILVDTTYNWRIREDLSSIGQQKHQLQNLVDRVAVKELAWQVVSSEASPRVVAAWLGRVLDIDLSLFVEFAVAADEEYRRTCQVAIAKLLDRADADAWRHVRVERKLRVALAAEGRWDLADRVIEYFRLNGALPTTRVVDGRVLASVPFHEELGLPGRLYELSDHQTKLSGCIRSATWTADGMLRMEGWAFIAGVDLTDVRPSISASLVNVSTGARRSLAVQPIENTAITRWADHPNQRYDSAGFVIVADVEELLAGDTTVAASWQLRVVVECAGVRREGPVHGIVRNGTGKRMIARAPESAAGRWCFVPTMDNQLGFTLLVRDEPVRATTLAVDNGTRVSGTVTVSDSAQRRPTQVVLRDGDAVVATSRLGERPDGGLEFGLDIRPGRLHRATLNLAVLDHRGKSRRVSWPSTPTFGQEIGAYGEGQVRWLRSPTGLVQLGTAPYVLEATAVRAHDSELAVEVRAPGVPIELLSQAILRGSAASVQLARLEQRGDDHVLLLFPLTSRRWGSDTARALPTGTYSIQLGEGAAPLGCLATDELIGTMPAESATRLHGITVARAPGTQRLTIALRAPLRELERGRAAQRRLAADYAARDYEPLDQVYFQCYRGEFATDSQRAIHDELVRRGTSLELIWGVYDLSVDLPPEAVPVVIGSQEWIDAVGSSRYLCHNIDFDRFFQRRPYQKFLQTFHGYPFKSMGISFWRTKNFSEQLLAQECARRNAAWTSILVPAQFCEEIYRREYRYTGEVLVTGYPRDDVLVRSEPGEREAVLNRLGVPPGKTVVLYAPTWREKAATGAWAAKFFDELDVPALSAALGPDYVVLLRGHNYVLRHGAINTESAAVVDVTRYPEINDLVIAADVAILDYSSLRFDWALTEKPVLFFVPDITDYLSQRTALFEYGPTAPGPLLSSTAEVAAALQDLDTVSAEFSQARKDFNERFNELHDGKASQRVVDAFFRE